MVEPKSGPTIIIVGAGAAGLSCAANLRSAKNKNYSIKIFEASNRLGGRIYDVHGFSDKFIEVGAELIHGNKSGFFNMAKAAGAEIKAIKDEQTIYCRYGGEFEEVEEYWERAEKSYKDFWNLYEDLTEKCKGKYPDVSVKDYLTSKGYSQESFYLADGLLGAEYSSDIDKISIQGVFQANYDWTAGSTDHFIMNMSMSEVLRKIYKNVIDDIVYETQIVKVDYHGNTVVLTDSKGQTHTCDKVVFAIPVTQYQKIAFEPKLSDKKLEALQKIQTDSSGKLFIRCAEQFWPKGTSFLMIPGLINVFWPSKRGKDTILTGFVGGKNCRELTRILKEGGKEKLRETIVKLLEHGIGVKCADKIIDFYWMDWGEAPFIEGGYTHPVVGEQDSRHFFAEPIQGKVFFAGDSFPKCNRGTIHGAIDSGNETANLLVKS